MADKQKKKINWKTVGLITKVSMFWVILAGVVILVQSVDKNSYTRGMQDGYQRAAKTIQSK